MKFLLLAIGGGTLPSVIIFRLSNERSEVINEKLKEILSHNKGELEVGSILSVGDKSIRARRLPIS